MSSDASKNKDLVYDDLIAKSWTVIYESEHFYDAYRMRADQLYEWSNYQKIIGLIVAPVLLYMVASSPDGIIKNILSFVAILGSLSSWVWAVLDLIYKFDDQMKRMNKNFGEFRRIADNIETNIVLLKSSDSEEAKSTYAKTIKKNTEKFRELQSDYNEHKVHVKGWQNLMAQQYVMHKFSPKTGLTCSECQQIWKPKSSRLSSKEAKALLKEYSKKGVSAHCRKCGQIITE